MPCWPNLLCLRCFLHLVLSNFSQIVSLSLRLLHPSPCRSSFFNLRCFFTGVAVTLGVQLLLKVLKKTHILRQALDSFDRWLVATFGLSIKGLRASNREEEIEQQLQQQEQTTLSRTSSISSTSSSSSSSTTAAGSSSSSKNDGRKLSKRGEHGPWDLAVI